MQHLNKKFGDSSDILDTDFTDWEDDFVSENVQFSDVENVIGSQNLIKSLQKTSNRLRGLKSISPLCQEKLSCHANIAALTCKEIKLPKINALNAPSTHVPLKDHKRLDIFSQEKSKPNVRKYFDEDSDSDDFYSPDKRRKRRKTLSENDFSNPNKNVTTQISILKNPVKTYQENCIAPIKEIQHQDMLKSQSDIMTISSQTAGSQIATVSTQESCSSTMITSSPEITASQEMISSQETSSSQNMITLSQENPASQNITSSQEFCCSPKVIASSQESLGNGVMNISIQEDFDIMNTANQTSSGTQIVITLPSSQQDSVHEIKSSESSILGQKTAASNKLMACNQRLENNAISSEKVFGIFDFPEKNKFTVNVASSVSDSFCNKTFRKKKVEKNIHRIRVKELWLTKRENDMKIREKQLKAREAVILKREEILKARERRILKYKTNLKLQKIKNNKSKKVRRRVGVLEDETNVKSY